MRKRVAAGVAIMMVLGSGAAHAAGRAAASSRLVPRAVLRAVATGAPVSVSLPGLGAVAVSVREHSLLAPNVRFTITGPDGVRVVPPPTVRTLAGSVKGDPTSTVRLTVTAAGVAGFVATRGEWFWIEPDGRVHRDAATPIEFGNDTVEATASHSVTEVNLLGIGSCSVQSCGELTALVVLDGDVSFTNLGADCFGRQMTVMNAVDGIYEATATRISLQVSQQNCRTAPDLGTTSTSAETLLGNLRTAWANQGADRSLVFLFAGYDIPAAIVGIAYRPGVCGRLEPENLGPVPQRCDYGFSLGQVVGSMSTLDLKTKVMAHEIGHNFNAVHDDTGCGGSGPIMCASIQTGGPKTFSTVSASAIRTHAENTIGPLAKIEP